MIWIHESLNCKTGWTSSFLAPPPLQGGASLLKGGACPLLNQARGGLAPPSCAPDRCCCYCTLIHTKIIIDLKREGRG